MRLLKVWLVRHGETDWNREGRWQGHTDVPLNAEGRAQAEALAARLRGQRLAAIATSDLSRARETAQAVAQVHGLPVLGPYRELRERGYGVFEGLTREQCEAQYPDLVRSGPPLGLLEPPGSEPRKEVGARLDRIVRALVTEHGDEHAPVLLVSHGGAIRTFLSHATEVMVPPVPNTGIYAVDFDGSRFVSPRLLPP